MAKKQRIVWNPQEYCRPDQWVHLTLAFDPTEGESPTKEGEVRQYIRIPIDITGDPEWYTWFLHPDNDKEHAIWKELYALKLTKKGSSFEFKIFPWINPETKKSSVQWAIRVRGREYSTIPANGQKTEPRPKTEESPIDQKPAKAEESKILDLTPFERGTNAVKLLGQIYREYIKELQAIADEFNLDGEGPSETEGTAWKELFHREHVSAIFIAVSKQI